MPGRNFYNDLAVRSPYIRSMESVIGFLMGAAMFLTLGLLVVGITSFAVYGKFYRCDSNHLMRARVVLQGIALIFFALLMYAFFGQG